MKAIVKPAPSEVEGMAFASVIVRIFLLLLVGAGCSPLGEAEGEPPEAELPSRADSGFNQLSEYGPVKVYIMPLTELIGDVEQPEKIKVYVSVLDAFDCQIKTPAVFRFELYDVVPRSTEPKGKRILIWPDIDLNDAANNNEYWQDFLRAYEFDLPFELQWNQSCILQVTSLCPDGKRLSAEFTLK